MKLTQGELGELLGGFLEKPWKVQAVYEAESGRRRFTAVELVALSQVLDKSITWLIDPGADHVGMPSGRILQPQAVIRQSPPAGMESIFNLLQTATNDAAAVVASYTQGEEE